MQNAIASSNYLKFPGIPAKFRKIFQRKMSNILEFGETLKTFMKYTSASRKRVTQEKLEHKSPLCICDTVELDALCKM